MWQMEQGQWALAAESLHEAVRMAREIGLNSTLSETQHALAKFHLKQLPEARYEVERLASANEPAHRYLAELWLAMGQTDQAKKHALAAYHWAWADGEPYVHRYELIKTRELLEQLGADLPSLTPYDSARDKGLAWEGELIAALEKLRLEKKSEPNKGPDQTVGSDIVGESTDPEMSP
jgi:tetratricopeptide (TPR) repeat protein